MLARLYMDAFECNNPLGSSRGTHKVLGFYYSLFTTLKAGSEKPTVQTIAILFEKDVNFFGLSVCLKRAISELKTLVLNGIYDQKLKKNLEIGVICSLGMLHN